MGKENSGFSRQWNKLSRRAFSSILHDPESAVISLSGGNSYRVDLRDAFLIKEAGSDSRALSLYYNLMTDPVVFTSVDRLTTLIYNMERRLVPGGESKKDKECYNYIKSELVRKAIEVRRAIDTASLAYLIGVTASEIMFYAENGKITFDIMPIDSRRLAFSLEVDEEDQIEWYQPRLKTDLNLYPGEVIPDKSVLIHRYYTVPVDSPYGLGVGQQLYWLVEFKKAALQLWNQISDRHSMPMVVGKVPDNTDGELVDKFFESLEEMAANGTFVIPDDFQIDLTNADTNNADVLIKDLIDYCDGKIREIILGESTSSNNIKPGLAGAARDARAITVQKAKRLTDEINHTLNRTLIKWLSNQNFPGATPPYLVTDTKDDEQLSGLLTNLKILSDLGYQVDPAWIEKKTGFPRKPQVEGLGDSIELPPEPKEYIDSRTVSDLNPTTK